MRRIGDVVNRESLHRESAGKRSTQVSTFEDLEVYQVEKFAWASQIRRAALSLTNNIAESHGRFHYPDQIKFTLQSRGSLEELIDDLKTCEDGEYLPSAEIATLKEQGWRVRQLIDRYIRYLWQQMNTGSTRAKEEEGSYRDGADDSRFSM